MNPASRRPGTSLAALGRRAIPHRAAEAGTPAGRRRNEDRTASDVEVPSPGTYRLYFDFTDRNTDRTAEFTALVA